VSVSGVSGTSSAAAASQASTAAKAAAPSNALGEDTFLHLLTTELQNQDPTQPMDNQAFITQLATFNSLSQLTSIKDSTAKMQQSLDTLNQLIAGLATVAVPNNSAATSGAEAGNGTGGTK
jgi:flagellar basal-body rod modification protein FlgD